MCLFGINDEDTLSLFQLARNTINYSKVQRLYWDHWTFLASHSPIWLVRITKYGGSIDKQNKCIQFEREDHEDEFYNTYNYEPDEQSCEIQNKTLPDFDNQNQNQMNWKLFQEKYNKNGIVDVWQEELEEFIVSKIKY